MRSSEYFRETKETKVKVLLNLDGRGKYLIRTPVGFLNHMLETLSKHSQFDLQVSAEGDINVSHHHLVEDVGITLGMAFKQALKEGKGIRRFGFSIVPMDEALVLCSLDISGRPLFFYEDKNLRGKITEFDFELIWEFFKGFCLGALITAHLKVLEGKMLHHVAEASFKAFALSLKDSVRLVSEEAPSTKGKVW